MPKLLNGLSVHTCLFDYFCITAAVQSISAPIIFVAKQFIT